MFFSNLRRPADSALVGEVQIAGSLRDDRRRHFGAEQRPGAGAEERARAADVDGGDGGTSVVARGRHDRRAGERRGHVRAHAADDRCRARSGAAAGAPAGRDRATGASPTSASRASTNCVVVAFVNSDVQLAGQPVVQQIGDRQRTCCAASSSLRRRAAMPRRAERAC